MELQVDTGPDFAKRARTPRPSTLGNRSDEIPDIACSRKQVDDERADGAGGLKSAGGNLSVDQGCRVETDKVIDNGVA
jgi:hypothetical protein